MATQYIIPKDKQRLFITLYDGSLHVYIKPVDYVDRFIVEDVTLTIDGTVLTISGTRVDYEYLTYRDPKHWDDEDLINKFKLYGEGRDVNDIWVREFKSILHRLKGIRTDRLRTGAYYRLKETEPYNIKATNWVIHGKLE